MPITPLPTRAVGAIRFTDYTAMTMEAWEARLREALADNDRAWEAAKGNRASYETTFGLLEQGAANTLSVFGPFALLVDGGDATAMDINEQLAPEVANLHSKQMSDPAFAAKCQDVYNREHENWPDYQVRAAEQWLLEMRLTGALLADDKQRERLATIAADLAKLETQFQKLCSEMGDATLWLEPSALEGVDPEALTTGEDGSLGVRLIREPVEAVLEQCSVRQTRKRVLDAFNHRGTDQDTAGADTTQIIERLLILRQEKAELLGFGDFAELNMANTMAGHPEAANALIQRTWDSVADSASRHLDAIELMAVADGCERMEPWDTAYYLKKAERDEAGEGERPTLGQTRKAVFLLAKRLFNLDFDQTEAGLPWAGMEAWIVKRNGQAIGGLLTDFAARAGKPSGAWMHQLIDGQANYGNVLPIVANTCNFGEGDDARLSAQDVRTVFHEFGHALHGLLGRTRLPSQSGTKTLHDWVELPSQLLENWVMDDECLAALGLPAGCGGQGGGRSEQIYKMRFLQAVIQDMAVHTRGLEGLSPHAFADKVIDERGGDRRITAWHRLPHFSHLFSGEDYAAGYYGYLWAEVLDADVFQWAKRAGPMERNTGEALERYIYARGDEVAPQQLFRSLLGRGPDPNALSVRLGVEPAKTKTGRP